MNFGIVGSLIMRNLEGDILIVTRFINNYNLCHTVIFNNTQFPFNFTYTVLLQFGTESRHFSEKTVVKSVLKICYLNH